MMHDDNKITIYTSTTPPKKSLHPSSLKKTKKGKELKRGSGCCVVGCEKQCGTLKTKCPDHLLAAKMYQKKYRTKKAQEKAQEIQELKAQLESLQSELEISKRRELQYQERLKMAKK